MRSVEVYILGQKYTIKGEAPAEYIERLAGYVDAKIKEVYNNSPNIAPQKATILAAINIADELYKLKSEQDSLTNIIEEKANTLAGLFEK